MRKIKFRFWMGNYAKPKYEHWDNLIKVGGDELIGRMLTEPYNPKVVIEQYTGINDSFGNEIYDGDILKISDGVHTTLEEVYFGVDKGENYPAYTITNLEWKFSANPFSELLDSETDYEFVVVGNIHENPEIMGGKRK